KGNLLYEMRERNKEIEEDYYMNGDGLLVFTAAYHLKRGKCCGNKCKHCPFDYINVPHKQAVRDSLK
ncbi:MAG: hypothetical protein ACI8S2_000606, partial [Bacteroidia bacterium]